jgi:hypothetical protein
MDLNSSDYRMIATALDTFVNQYSGAAPEGEIKHAQELADGFWDEVAEMEGSVAQSVERGPFKPMVAGSRPARSTTPKKSPSIVPGPEMVMAQELAREWGRECPVCAARRIKKAAAMKRWREKRRK